MRETILNEIRKLAAASGGTPPGAITFRTQTGIREAVWRGIYWARWGDALVDAGFRPNDWRGKHDTELVFLKLIEACRHFSKVPTKDELNMYRRTQSEFPSVRAMFTHFSSKDGLLSELRAWVQQRAGYEDIAAMLGEGPIADPQRRQPQTAEGFVYLIRSGPHYKIGRSEELERRVKQIRVALPEAATLVHSIRTDDPAGIEVYWHRRFEDKRANGEWFKLTNSDVAAFKRRKFQ